MANASVDGRRYIITGIEVDDKGQKNVHGVDRDDFSGNPAYQSLVTDYIEPPIRVTYQRVSFGGKHVGVYEIGNCQDRPYMMRMDQSEKLRRGDAYVRRQDTIVKMGRRQLQELFERKFHDSVSGDRIEIGFPGEIIHKEFRIPTVELAKLPSALAGAKLNQTDIGPLWSNRYRTIMGKQVSNHCKSGLMLLRHILTNYLISF